MRMDRSGAVDFVGAHGNTSLGERYCFVDAIFVWGLGRGGSLRSWLSFVKWQSGWANSRLVNVIVREKIGE